MPARPMFPLGSVLLPGMVLPLHVFEPRYRALVRDCLEGEREFGVTLIERGSEVGGGDIRAMFGTMARIVEAQELEDGRWGLLAVGTDRFRVREWLPDEPYPRAEVELWPDEPITHLEAAQEAYRARVAQLRRVLAMAVELGMEASPMIELSDDPGEGSYQIAVLAPLEAMDRQLVLTTPGPEDRLAMLASLLDDQELMLGARISDG